MAPAKSSGPEIEHERQPDDEKDPRRDHQRAEPKHALFGSQFHLPFTTGFFTDIRS
jgi:hypothetical protein